MITMLEYKQDFYFIAAGVDCQLPCVFVKCLLVFHHVIQIILLNPSIIERICFFLFVFFFFVFFFLSNTAKAGIKVRGSGRGEGCMQPHKIYSAH